MHTTLTPKSDWLEIDTDNKLQETTNLHTHGGMYVFRCHILNHEDHGMMGVVNVS